MLRLIGGAQKHHCIHCRNARDKGPAPGRKQRGATMTYFGILGRTRSLLVLASLATAAALPTLRPADAAANHDGIWSVVIITNQGICDQIGRASCRESVEVVVGAGSVSRE